MTLFAIGRPAFALLLVLASGATGCSSTTPLDRDAPDAAPPDDEVGDAELGDGGVNDAAKEASPKDAAPEAGSIQANPTAPTTCTAVCKLFEQAQRVGFADVRV